MFVDPSAGEGAFFKQFPARSLGYDIEPKHPDIIEADFLEIELPLSGDIAVIGNPPFGKNSSLAVRFFNHAATFASTIAFIVPRTFQKQSIHKRLNSYFHCVFEEVLDEDSFIFEGERKRVPTVFQIWERRPEARVEVPLPTTHPDFEITTPEHADFAIQRVGSKAGCVHRRFSASPNAHYFIKAKTKDVEAIMRSLDLASLARRTAGNPSLAKTELVAAYVERKNALI